MEDLVTSRELYLKIVEWMGPKYSINSVRQYSYTLRKWFKTYEFIDQNTIRRIHKSIKHHNQRAVMVILNEYCFENDIDFHVNIPKVRAQPKKTPEILSPDEIELMIKSTPKPYDLAIRCIFNMGAGLRVSEIIKFSWNHIRWIDWLKNQDSYGVAVIRSGKGSKDRVVNIPHNLMRDLYEYAKEQKVLNEYRIPSGTMVFRFGSNQKYKIELLKENIDQWKNQYVKYCYDWFRYNIVKLHCEKALNKRIKIHQLRHSRATYLYEVEKVPIEQIAVLLGHASLNTTMIYTKINPVSIFERVKNAREV